MAAKKKASKKKATPAKKAVVKKTAAKKKRANEDFDFFDEAPVERKSVGHPRAMETDENGIWLGCNLFAKEAHLNDHTVTRRMNKSPAKVKRTNTGTPIYRLHDLLTYVILADDSGKVDIDKLPPIQRKAHYQAENERMDLLKDSGQLIEAGEVEKEMARQAKIVTQFCDTLPDILERDCGVGAVVLTKIEQRLDALRIELHKRMVEDEEIKTPA